MTRPLPAPFIALVFFAAVLLTRLAVMQRSVLDWDESLYFLMAQAWRGGHLPYTAIWDNKPIGIYAIFAVFQAVFGGGVFAMRLATVAFISLLAFIVFQITEILTTSRAASWVAGTALVVGSLSNDGLSANTELFMATFTALAVWAALATRWGVLVGLGLGAAFMIKYVAMFEAPAVLGLYVWRQRRWGAALAVALGGLVPLALVVALYAQAGKLGLWWDCSVVSNFRRVNAPVTQAALTYAWQTEWLRWGSLYAGGLAIIGAALFRRRGPELFLAFWLLGGAIGVASAKSFYDHYFLQLLPVLCVILGVWFARLPARQPLRAGFVIAALVLPAWAAWGAHQAATVPDFTAQVAADLKAQHPASIYVFDSQPILYALTGQTPPTRYVLPSELTGLLLPRVAGVNAAAEVARILATSPEFIIRRDDPTILNPVVYNEVNAAVATHYVMWRKYPGVLVYKRR